jgi:type I restriction enzyme, S subunit
MGYPSYSEYQESKHKWLGKIPGHWGSVVLKRKFHIVNGSTPKSSAPLFWDGDIVWITPADFDSAIDGYIHTSSRMITNDGLSSCGTTLVPEKSVVVTTRAPIGRIAQAGSKLCTNQGCKTLVRDSNDLIERFIFYTLVASGAQLNALGLGTTFMELSKDDLGYYPVALPSPTEQQKIADFLDWKTGQIDGLIAKKKRLIEKLKEKRIAWITRAVTKGLNPDAPMRDSGIPWLGEVPEHWEVKRLRFLLCERFTNGLFKKADFWGEGYRIVNVTDLYIQNDLVEEENLDRLACNEDELKTYSANHGDFFIVRSSLKSEGIGKSAALLNPSEPTVFECHIVRGRPNLEYIHPRFLNLFMNSAFARKYFMTQANLVTMATIDQERIKNLVVAFPSYEEQQQIADRVDQNTARIDTLTTKNEQLIKKLTEYRTALITAATTGKIDVRKVKMGGVA